MLNKNDPLIGAVQEVMKKNQAERDAVRLVNEKFGVTDRKALPHEKQGEWDAAYKQVLSEGLHPNQQKLDVHEPEKDKLTAQDFKMLRSKKKPMEEENAPKTDPYAEGQASSISTVSQPKKEVTPADQSALKKKIMSIKEAKANPYAIGMAAVKKSTGDEPPMEKKNIMKAHKIAKKIIAKKKIDEGFNNRHGLSVTASAEKQAVAEQVRARSDYGLGAIPAQKNAAQRRAELDARMEKGIDTVAPFIPGVGAARAIDKYARGQQGLGQTAVDVGLNLAGGAAGALVKGGSKLAKIGYNALRGARTAKNLASPAARGAATAADKSAGAVSAAAKKTDDLAQTAPSLQKLQPKPQTANRPYNVAGAQSKLPPKPRTTQSGVPAIVSKKGPGRSNVERVGPFNPIGPRAPVRPTAPNAAAGNAARMAARQRLAAAASAASKDKVLKGAAATGLGAAGLKVAQSQYSSTTPSSAAGVTDAKAQGAKVGTSTLTKPSGSTAQPYGMNIPRKLNPDSRIAKGNVTPGAPPKTAAPQAQRPQPQANQPSATERRENRRMLDKGLVVGPEAKRAQQRSGTGVTIQQKAAPQVNRPVGTGRVK